MQKDMLVSCDVTGKFGEAILSITVQVTADEEIIRSIGKGISEALASLATAQSAPSPKPSSRKVYTSLEELLADAVNELNATANADELNDIFNGFKAGEDRAANNSAKDWNSVRGRM